MTTAILGIITTALAIILIWMQTAPGRDKAKVWADFKALEESYREALAKGDVMLVSVIAKRLQDMRDKYKFLGV